MSHNMTYSRARLTELTTALMVEHRFAHIKTSQFSCFTPCDQIDAFVPDVTGYAEGTLIIAATASELDLSLGAAWLHPWVAFFDYAKRIGGHFLVIVNKADVCMAQTILEQVCGDASNAHVWGF
jgi:hypothetical protein